MSAGHSRRQASLGGNQPQLHRRLGFWVLVVCLSFLAASLPLQFLINASVAIDTTASMVLGTIVWLIWIAWLVAAVVVLAVWIFKKLRRSGS